MAMTVEEAIYCMRSYLGLTDCTKCPYYGSVSVDDQTTTCRSDEAHRLAILALIGGVPLDDDGEF